MHAKFKDDQTNITKYRQENPNEVFDLSFNAADTKWKWNSGNEKSIDQLAKMTCEDAYNWYNKPAAYCSYVGQRFDLEDFRKTIGQLERDYVKGIMDVDGNPCDESQFNWRNFCAGANINSISLLLLFLGKTSEFSKRIPI